MEESAALGVAAILGAMAVVQVALALGAPWGAHAWGGRVAGPGEPLPGPYRLASVVAIGLLLAAAWLVLARAGLFGVDLVDAPFVRRGTWAVAGYLGVNTLANLASTSPVERWGFGAATAAGTLLTVLVATS